MALKIRPAEPLASVPSKSGYRLSSFHYGWMCGGWPSPLFRHRLVTGVCLCGRDQPPLFWGLMIAQLGIVLRPSSGCSSLRGITAVCCLSYWR